MDTAIARERLEEMRGQIDRSILVLEGEHPSDVPPADSPQDPADAGATLSETDRTEAALAAVAVPAAAGHGRARADRPRCLRDVRRLRQADPGGPAGCQAGGGTLRGVPVQAGPAALSPACRRQPAALRALRAVATRLMPNASSALPRPPDPDRPAVRHAPAGPWPRLPAQHVIHGGRGQRPSAA